MLATWINGKFIRWFNPWGGVVAVAAGWILYGIFH